MRKLGLGAAAAATFLTAAAAASGASAAPADQLIFGVDTPADHVALEKVQYFWGGRNYCWYDGG